MPHREGSVTGVDPARFLQVNWISGDGRTLHLSQHFDFIYMTGHAFQALRTDDDALALLRAASDHLASNGRFAFDSRNPAHKAWLAWNRESTRVVTTAEHGRIEEFYTLSPTRRQDSSNLLTTIAFSTKARQSLIIAACGSLIGSILSG